MSESVLMPSTWIRAGWFLWTLSAFCVALQISTMSQIARNAPRFLAKAADEDDKFASADSEDEDGDDDLVWYQLQAWVDPASLAYDIIEGFLYVADAFFIAWVLWGCLVHCGVLPDERLERRRRLRRLKDGRGVFAPIRDFDPLQSSDDEDDRRDSMEYGDTHEDEEYGEEIDVKKEEENIKRDAENFFRKGEKRKSKKDRKSKIEEAGPMEDGVLLLDFEMAPTPPRQNADVMFL